VELYPWKGVRSTRRFGWNLSVHVENLGSLVFGAAVHVLYALCSVQCNAVVLVFRNWFSRFMRLHADSGFWKKFIGLASIR